MSKSVLSVITARAGSKGVIGKNYKLLNGVPLVGWSIFHSICCPDIDLTVVSSNCPHVRRIVSAIQSEIRGGDRMGILDTKYASIFNVTAMDFGRLEFIQRPDRMATDTSRNEEALVHAYEHAKKSFEINADIIVNLQPTSPIRSEYLIHRCLEKFLLSKADSLFTATRHTPFFFKDKDGVAIAKWDYKNRPMRQELEEDEFLFHDNGNIYVMSRNLLLKSRCRMGGKMVMFETDRYEGIQVDTTEDFAYIKYLISSGLIDS